MLDLKFHRYLGLSFDFGVVLFWEKKDLEDEPADGMHERELKAASSW